MEDDGKGFPVDDNGGGGQGTLRLGLLGIRERLALVDGTLEVEFAARPGHDPVRAGADLNHRVGSRRD